MTQMLPDEGEAASRAHTRGVTKQARRRGPSANASPRAHQAVATARARQATRNAQTRQAARAVQHARAEDDRQKRAITAPVKGIGGSGRGKGGGRKLMR